MKKVIIPILFALLLGVSSANAVDSRAKLNTQPIFQNTPAQEKYKRCTKMCMGEKDYFKCVNICNNS